MLVIQLSGEKTWEVRGASRPVPMYRDAARNDEPSQETVWEGTIRAGDVMHMPRGYWHQATRTGQGAGHSLHMTLGITQRTGVSWLAWLADWSRETERFRHDLDRWGRPGAQHRQHQELAAAAARLLDERGPAEFLDTVQRQADPARHVPFVAALGPPEAVVCVTEFPPRLHEDGQGVEVIAADKRLVFDPKALPALRLLLSGHPVRLEEAAAHVGADITTVAEILVEEELCAPLNPELSSGYTGLVPPAPC
ncbi:hypothetical protein ADL21_00030 [Streptomyces albus subsp. albus]|nr:hypothetical protein ADL21_00030 [Streptomyces albus subsp. albus]